MPTANSKSTVEFSKRPRRNTTEGEKRLWRELRDFKLHYGLHVRRQAPIGVYVADFAIQSVKLIIEVDGEHHFMPEAIQRDAKRDAWFTGQGYEIIRFTTGDLDEIAACIDTILANPRLKPLLI